MNVILLDSLVFDIQHQVFFAVIHFLQPDNYNSYQKVTLQLCLLRQDFATSCRQPKKSYRALIKSNY